MNPRAIPLGRIALLALGGLAAALAGGIFAPGWLAAALVWGSLPLGAVAILMVHHLTGGRWGEAGRAQWLALVATLPLFAAALLPLLAGLQSLFAWTGPAEALPQLVRNKLAYLNAPFFILRSLAYFALWLWLARGPGRVPAPGLLLWLLALTFFAFDWLMSLEPEFYSDIYGLMLAANTVAAAFAWALLLGARQMESGARRDIANLWLGVLLGWAFFAFSQYIVIWSANLPDEIGWYIHRSRGLWRAVSVLSFALFFLLPFSVLLSGRAKGSARWLRLAAASCLFGHTLQVGWLVLPPFDHGGLWSLLLLAALVPLLGIVFFAAYRHGEPGADTGGEVPHG